MLIVFKPFYFCEVIVFVCVNKGFYIWQKEKDDSPAITHRLILCFLHSTTGSLNIPIPKFLHFPPLHLLDRRQSVYYYYHRHKFQRYDHPNRRKSS